MANTLAEKYGVKDYLKLENFDENANEDLKNNLIENINKEIEDNYNKHTAIKHYKDVYNFIPPFVLTKILTFGIYQLTQIDCFVIVTSIILVSKI